MNNPFDTIDVRLKSIEALLIELRHTEKEKKNVNDDEQLLTVEQCAEFLNLSRPTIYGLISRGELPVMKRSKRCYFLKEDLIKYIKAGRRKTNQEIREEADEFLTKKK